MLQKIFCRLGAGLILLCVIGCMAKETTCRCYCNDKIQGVGEAPDGDEAGPGLRIPTLFSTQDLTDTEADAGVPSADETEAVKAPSPSESQGRYTEPDCSNELVFKDPQMTLLVRRRLKRTHGPIFVREVATWTEFSTQFGNGGASISNLAGIECFSALERLTISNSDIRDLTPISRLRHLKELVLTGAGVQNVEVLALLPKLTKLVLDDNRISDTAQFVKLAQLESLDLNNNQISKLAPLARLTRLQRLGLAGNRITDAEPLSKMTGLKRLDLDKNNVKDIRFVKKLSNLTSLSLSNNGLSDIRPLSDVLPLLTELRLIENPISDFTPLTRTLGSGLLDITLTGIDCVRHKPILEIISIRWTEMYVDCPEFNTGV